MSKFETQITALIDATCKGTVNDILTANENLLAAIKEHGFKEWKGNMSTPSQTGYYAVKAAVDKAVYVQSLVPFLDERAKNSIMIRPLLQDAFARIDSENGF